MSFLRKDKIKRPEKEVKGDHKIAEQETPSVGWNDPLADLTDDERIERSDVLADLIGLDLTETELNRLFIRARAKLKDINIKIETPTVRAALATLNDGVPTDELTLELIQRALDLHLDSFMHVQGFDVVPTIMRCHEDPDDIKVDSMPKVPLPHPLFKGPFGLNDKHSIQPMECSKMQQLENMPDPEIIDSETGQSVPNSDYSTEYLNIVVDKVKRFTLLDLLMKLAALFIYFIAKFVRDFVHPYRNKKFIKGLIRGIIRKMEKIMKKAWCKITEECSDEERYPADDIEDLTLADDISYINAIGYEDFEHRGIACVEAAAMVMKHLDETERGNTELYALFKAEEAAQYHEAQKHGLLMAISDRDEFKERVQKLNKTTNEKPRYKKRYGVCREHFKKRLDKSGIFDIDDNN